MRKLYLIIAATTSTGALSTIGNVLEPYSSKQVLTQNSWIVASGQSAWALHRDLTKTLANDCFVIVAALTGNIAWSRSSADLNSWLTGQLAGLTS